jgi:transposase-like protein
VELDDVLGMEESAQSSSKSEVVKPKRRQRSEEERQRIVQASLKAGTTVDAVARLYGVHASQIYDWGKQHRQRIKAEKRSVLVPVQVTENAPVAAPETKQECNCVIIEARSVRVTLKSSVDAAVIATVLECLAK